MYDFTIPSDLSWRRFKIKKKTPGEFRQITAPNAELKDVQRNVLRYLESNRNLAPTAFAHGFVRFRNALSGAMRHDRKAYAMITIDVKDFFDTFPVSVVKERLLSTGMSDVLVDKILKLCVYENQLPQGGPCSPILTNIGMFICDKTLGGYARNNGLRYSRYADDLTFSYPATATKEEVEATAKRHIAAISGILEKECKLKINKKKIHVARIDSPRTARIVTGIVIRNDGLGYNAPKRMRRKARAMCHKLAVKVMGQNGVFRDEDHVSMLRLVGYVRYFDYIRSGGEGEAATADPKIQEKYWNYLTERWMK